MSVFDVPEIVDRLVGRAEWVGETHADKKSLENLRTIDDLMEHLLSQLIHNVNCQKSHPGNYSAEELGGKSKDLLIYIKGQIESAGL